MPTKPPQDLVDRVDHRCYSQTIESEQDSSFSSDSHSEAHTPRQSPFHRRQLWSPIQESPPEYPDDPRHPHHIAMDDVRMPPDIQIDEDTMSKAPHISPYEVTPGVLADDAFSDTEMQDILDQQQHSTQEVYTPDMVHTQTASHREMNTVTSSNQGNETSLFQTKPGGKATPRSASC